VAESAAHDEFAPENDGLLEAITPPADAADGALEVSAGAMDNPAAAALLCSLRTLSRASNCCASDKGSAIFSTLKSMHHFQPL
jgi:hypothetical protein